jgi:VanZ family protein
MRSTNHSTFGFRLVSLALFAVIALMTLGPVGGRPHTHLSPDFDRFAAYALLGSFYALAYPRWRLWILAVCLVAAAGALEWAQLYVPGRDAGLSDFVFKAVGAIIGLLAGRLLPRLFRPVT